MNSVVKHFSEFSKSYGQLMEEIAMWEHCCGHWLLFGVLNIHEKERLLVRMLDSCTVSLVFIKSN